ncbi:5'-AMP-activated protein kinase subunit gamma-2 [Echinococcus granulosus]|nr:5'-AMP-activated protein kinase subunit gamma-2 [Echinococcus granulosus]
MHAVQSTMNGTHCHGNGIRKTKSEGSICIIRMLISFDDRAVIRGDVESVLVNNLFHSMGPPTPATERTQSTSRRHSFGMHHLLGALKRHRSSTGPIHEKFFEHHNHCINNHGHYQHSTHKMEEFSGQVALTTHHTGLLLSLPSPVKPVKTVHFLVGKQEDYDLTNHLQGRRRSRLFTRHSVSATSKSHLVETAKASEEGDVIDFPLRRSISLGRLMEDQNRCMDVVFQRSDSSHFEIFGLDTKHILRRKIRRVARGFNLTDMHWVSKKHSTSSRVSLKSTSSYETTISGGVTLTSSSLRIQTDEVTPLRSLAPANLSNSTDPRSHHVGRFVVLKATVSNTNEEAPPLDDAKMENEPNSISGPPENHYWTVSGGKGVLLTAPGARRFDVSRPTSGGPNRPMHSRFRQFFVENLRSSRLRTHSEQQQNHNQGGSSSSSRGAYPIGESPNKLKPPTVKFGAGLPPHAHTITAGTSSAVTRALLQSTQRAKDDGLIGAGEVSPGTSGMSSSPMNRQCYPSVSLTSVNDSDGTGSFPISKKRLKSTHKMVRKLLKLSPGQKKHVHDSEELPDPSKLPRELPQSSLEFTQSRLKNAPRRSVPSNNYGRKGKTGPQLDVIPRVLPQGGARSEELLLSAFSRSLSGSSSLGSSHHSHGHHHKHHDHHRGHHSHDRYAVSPMALTRVTENRRYLMFTKASPFRSPYEFLQTRGKGLSESEVYTVLFRHTTCYELMPESAKLVTLDSMLPVGKAFRALCVNGIRAAPVWDSETQTFSGVLTINDFLEMLTYSWRRQICNSAREGEKTAVEDIESTPIKKWKEIRARTKNRKFSGIGPHDTIHEEDEEVKEEQVKGEGGDGESCSSSCSSSSSSDSDTDDGDGDDDDGGDSNSVASAPSQLGELEHTRIHSGHHRQGYKHRSVRVCECRRMGGGCSMRLKHHRMGGLTIIYPEDSLYTALRLLAHCKLHRLPVFDDPVGGTGNPLFVLTHRSLLAYLYKKQIDLPRPKYLQAPLKEARVGTYENLALVLPSTKLVDALAFFEDERVSVLPVVDSLTNRRLIDIFAKFDVITLILAGKHKKPDMTVQDVLDICKQIHRGVIPIPEGQNMFDVEICRTTDTIQFALNKLMRTGYHRLIIVDNSVDCRVEGVVSISDLLYYMVLRPSPRGSVAPSQTGTTAKQPETDLAEASARPTGTGEDDTAPDWLFYSEQDPNALRRKPCVPLVKYLPNSTSSLNGKEGATAQRQERHRLRVTSGSSVTTVTTSTASSRSSSTASSSSSTSSTSSTASSTDYSSSSASSSSSSADKGSRSRSNSPKATPTAAKTTTRAMTAARDTRRAPVDRRGGERTRTKMLNS